MTNEPNTKAEYPPLPEHPEPDGFLTIRIAGRDVEINAYRDSTMRDYAEACIDADRAMRTQLSYEAIEKIAVKHEAFGFGRVDDRGLTTHGFDPVGLIAFVKEVLAAAPSAPAAPQPAAPQDEFLPLLARDIANELGTTSINVCEALRTLGFGCFSLNMAITKTMAAKLREHFATHPAEGVPAQGDAKDAQRYRYLRDKNNSLETRQRDTGAIYGTSCYHDVGGVRELKYGAELDAAVDAVIIQTKESKT